MSNSKQNKKEPRVRDVQKQILEIVLKRNPSCTVAEFSKSYNNMVRYFKGGSNDNY